MENQIKFLNRCKEKVSQRNLSDVLCEVLNLNKDAVYRRMRGETPLSFEEVKSICLNFRISFDSTVNYHSNAVPFQFNAMFRPRFEIVEYLKNISTELKAMGEDEDSKLILTAMDLPYFRQFGFNSLSRFKLFFWQKSVLNLDSFQHRKFNWEESMDDFEEVTQEIYKNYHRISSVEIWAPETIDSTIKQILYYWESGLFVSEDSAIKICTDLELLLDKLEREAEIGKKAILSDNESIESSLAMYQSDIFLSNNSIQAYRNERIYTYVSFNSFNSLMSYTPRFSKECHKWIEQIRMKSILLSEVSEKLRYQYFLGLRNKLKELKERLSKPVM